MKSPTTSQTLQNLPSPALSLILRHVLSLPPDHVLHSDSPCLSAAVTLARVSTKLRIAAANTIHHIKFLDAPPGAFWPSVTVLSPFAWARLQTLECTVNRSSMMAFLKWLIPADGLTTLRLRVVGEPYGNERLTQLERLLLGRLFTQGGVRLEELDVEGVDCQALLFAALFQCTSLRKLRLTHYGEVKGESSWQMLMLLCLINRPCLQTVEFPFQVWKDSMATMMTGTQLYAACKVTWNMFWGSYRAGLKESAVNLQSGEDELVALFNKISIRMDKLEADMRESMLVFENMAPTLEPDDMPVRVLSRLLPRLELVNGQAVRGHDEDER